jgi:MFS transporter, putative metabolite transport protein
MLTIERVGRRQQLIGPFWVMAAALLVVGLWASAPGGIIVACFAVFAFTNALQGNLTAVYPAEVFPTELRSTGIGFSTAFSRIGAASGTFLVPLFIDWIGISGTLFVAVALTLAGLLITWAMAPETKGLTLAEAAGAGGTYRRARRAEEVSADRAPVA